MRLYQMHYSPWSERARWALDHHHLRYETTEHLPVLGGPMLRVAAKKLSGRVTAPLLVDGETSVFDSLDIARYAEQKGTGEPLFPEGSLDDILRWNTICEALVSAGRILVTHKAARDRDAQLEATPAFLPEALRPAAASSAGLVTGLLARKYGFENTSEAEARALAREPLFKLRDALGPGVRHLVGDRFTYADIVAATSLQFLRPVADVFWPIGPATRRTWSNPDLAEEFVELLLWRDRTYAEHRQLGWGSVSPLVPPARVIHEPQAGEGRGQSAHFSVCRRGTGEANHGEGEATVKAGVGLKEAGLPWG